MLCVAVVCVSLLFLLAVEFVCYVFVVMVSCLRFCVDCLLVVVGSRVYVGLMCLCAVLSCLVVIVGGGCVVCVCCVLFVWVLHRFVLCVCLVCSGFCVVRFCDR